MHQYSCIALHFTASESSYVTNVEQTAHAFLKQQGHRKSQCKIKGGCQQGAIKVTVSKLHEIWQVEVKWPSEQQLSLCHKISLENGEFLHLGPENYNFAIYSNFCFLNNFLLKSQNKVSLVLGWPLRSVVYDFAFNSILLFFVNFGILLPNRVISANQDFKFFSQYLYVLQLSEVNQIIINKHRLLSNSFSSGFQFISLWIQGNPSWIRGLLLEANSLVSIPSREHHVCFLQASATS